MDNININNIYLDSKTMKKQFALQDEDDQMINEATAYFQKKLPLPFSKLQHQVKKIPKQMLTEELQSAIYSKNKEIIFSHFCQLVSLTATIFVYETFEKHEKPPKIIEKINQSVFKDYPEDKINYQKRIAYLMKKQRYLPQNPRQSLHVLLQALARTHYENFEFDKQETTFTMAKSKLKTHQIPEKFDNYISQVIEQNFPNQEKGSEIQEKREADKNAALLRTIFFGEIENDIEFKDAEKLYPDLEEFANTIIKASSKKQSKQPIKSGSSFKPTSSVMVNLIEKKKDQSNIDLQNALNQLLVAIEQGQLPRNQQVKVFKTRAPTPLVEGYCQKKLLTYYEKNLMMHLSHLILNRPFDISLVKGDPYIRSAIDFISGAKSELKQYFEGLNNNMKKTQRQNKQQLPVEKHFNRKPSPEAKKKHGIVFNLRKICGNIYKQFSKGSQKGEVQEQRKFSQIQTKTFSSLKTEFEEYSKNLDEIVKEFEPLSHHYHVLGTADYEDLKYYHEKQSWIILIIYMYRQFIVQPEISNKSSYTATKRRILCNILKKMLDAKRKPKPQFLNWSVVYRYLENNRTEVSQIKNTEVIKKSEIIIKDLYQNLTNHTYLRTMNNNIFQGGLQNFKESLPMLRLVNLNKAVVRSKVVHLLISGFLSEDSDKNEEWADMVEKMPGCEIYALLWESNTIKNLVLFLMKATKDVITAETFGVQLQKKYKDNPFVPAFEVARITGRLLAQLVVRLFPTQFVSLCGYSLGSQVIKEFMSRMIQSNHQRMIYNVRIMGGVSDTVQLEELLSKSKSSMSVINCVTKHDGVLKHILSLVKPQLKPMGINQINKVDGHFISNINCNKIISGHLKYRSHLDLMGKILQMIDG